MKHVEEVTNGECGKKVEFDINGILFKKSLINDLINLDIQSN